jgi:glyoxylase-like metal-dependent hydrolase (beta-lactamase superfamily II)
MESVYTGNSVEIFEVSPKLYFRRGDLMGRGQCNCYIFVTENGVGIVDPSTPEAAQEMLQEIELLFKKPLRYVFLTHNHSDHSDGLPVFLNLPVTIFCSHKCEKDVSRINTGPAAVVGIKGSLSMTLGGYRVEVTALDDVTHSPWDIVVRFPEESAICTGDLVVEFETLYFQNSNPERWAASLRELANGRDKYVLPGHGGVYPASMITDVADHLELLIEAAHECIDRSMPLRGLFVARDPDYDTLDGYAADYIALGGEKAQKIIARAGGDAQRQIRMVTRNQYYHELV